jgi:hypothetical protein
MIFRVLATTTTFAFASCVTLGCGGSVLDGAPLDAGDHSADAGDHSALDAGLVVIASPDSATASPDASPSCGDTDDDPHNCGACGHDCFGTACAGGTCTPLPVAVLATGQSLPAGLAVDDAGVYWLDLGVEQGTGKAAGPYVGGALMTCAKSGCASGPTALVSGVTEALDLGEPAPLVALGGNVYFAAVQSQSFTGQVLMCATGGCNGSATLIASGFPWAMATNGAALFWTEGSQSLVLSCALGGCGGAPTALFAPPAQSYPLTQGIAADTTSAYWIVTGVADNIVSCAVTGCNDAPSPLGNTLPENAQIVADANNLYFTDANPIELGGILTCPKSGCSGSPTVLASGRSAPHGIAVDSARVYWTEEGDDVVNGVEVPNAGGVYACAVAGCGDSPTAIATGQQSPMGIAVDDSRVYWTTEGPDGGQVLSVAKP